jgi:hypothetical protein
MKAIKGPEKVIERLKLMGSCCSVDGNLGKHVGME